MKNSGNFTFILSLNIIIYYRDIINKFNNIFKKFCMKSDKPREITMLALTNVLIL